MIRQAIATGRPGPSGYKIITLERRHPTGDEVAVDVRASGLNFYDIYVTQGLGNNKIKFPCPLGLECAGVVTEIGKDVQDTKVGDHVVVFSPEGGTFTEFLVVKEQNILVVPKSLSFRQLSAITINYLTAHFTLNHIGNIRDGQSIFIHGVAGGVGWAVTQLAKKVPGVSVIGTASKRKHQEAKKNGVDVCLSYDEDLKSSLLKYSPGGVDVIIESMAGKHFEECKEFLKPMGKLILIGAKNMIIGERASFWSTLSTWWNTKYIDPTSLIMKNMCVAGFNLAELFRMRPETFRKEWKQMIQLLVEKKISPRIDGAYKLDEVYEACQCIIHHKNIGKIIIVNEK